MRSTLLHPTGVSISANGDVVATFSNEAMQQAEEAATVRSNGSRSNGLYDQRIAPKQYTNLDIDRIGVMGEMVLAAWLGLPVRVSSEKDPGLDFTLASGHTLDAKSAFSEKAPLRFAKPCRADLAALVVRLDARRMRLVGWTEAPDKGQTAQSRLKPPNELLELHVAARDHTEDSL